MSRKVELRPMRGGRVWRRGGTAIGLLMLPAAAFGQATAPSSITPPTLRPPRSEVMLLPRCPPLPASRRQRAAGSGQRAAGSGQRASRG